MTTALVTRSDARMYRWIANWASLISDLLLDSTLASRIKTQIERPDVQDALRKIYAEQAA